MSCVEVTKQKMKEIKERNERRIMETALKRIARASSMSNVENRIAKDTLNILGVKL